VGRHLVRTVFDQARHRRGEVQFGDKFPDTAEHLDDARDDRLAFTAFPHELWSNCEDLACRVVVGGLTRRNLLAGPDHSVSCTGPASKSPAPTALA